MEPCLVHTFFLSSPEQGSILSRILFSAISMQFWDGADFSDEALVAGVIGVRIRVGHPGTHHTAAGWEPRQDSFVGSGAKTKRP